MSLTAEYLEAHPFASPDIIDPPEAPVYRYRPDITSELLLAELLTATLGAGSRVDVIIGGAIASYVLQDGVPTGAEGQVIPVDYNVSTNNVYWLLVGSTGSSTGTIDFTDITGQISLDQLPPGTIISLDDPGDDAFYYFNESTGLPTLALIPDVTALLGIDALGTRIDTLTFSQINGLVDVNQLAPDIVTSVDSIDEDGVYFFDNTTFLPKLLGHDDFVTWLGVTGGGSIASTTTFLTGDGAGAAIASNLEDDGAGDLNYTFAQNNQDNISIVNHTSNTFAGCGMVLETGTTGEVSFVLGAYSPGHDAVGILLGSDGWLWHTGRIVIGAIGPILFANDGVTTERARINNGLSVGSTTDPGAGNILLGGLTASSFVETDSSKILVSKTASQMRTDLGLGTLATQSGTFSGTTSGTNTGDQNLSGYVPTTTTVNGHALSSNVTVTPTDLSLVIGTNVQAFDADLSALAALSGTNTIYYRSAANTWTAVTIGSNLSFSGGTLDSSAPGTGDVVGPSSAVDAELVLFNSTTGKLIKRATGSGLVKATSGVYSNVTDNSTNWDTAYTDRNKWDGGATGLTAATGRTSLGLVIGTNVQAWDADLDTLAGLTATTDNFIVSVSSAWASRTPAQVRTTLSLVIGTDVQAYDADLTTIAGLTATTDNFIVSVSSAWASRTPAQVKTTLGLVIGTNVQAWDADLDTLAGLTATTDNFIVSVSSAWASRTPAQVLATLAAVGTTFQPLDSDLTTIAGLTATTDNFIVSVSSAWASRTPSQVKTTLGLVIGTNVQAWDADLDTLAGLTATTDNFIVSVSSAWASRTPTQVKSTLGLVIGTNVQAWDADLDTLAGLTATTDNFIVSVSSAWASRTPTQVKSTLGLVIGTNVEAWSATLDSWAGKTVPSGTVVGDTDTQTLTNKTIDGTSNTPTKIPHTVAVGASDFTDGTTNNVDITGLSFAVAANKNYYVQFFLATNKSAGAAGIKFRFTGPSSPTTVALRIQSVSSSLSTAVNDYISAFSSATAAFNTFAGDAFVLCPGGMIANGANAGTVQLQLQGQTSGTSKVYAGSWLSYTLLN